MKDSTLHKFFNINSSHWESLLFSYAVKIVIAVVLLIIGFWIINRILRVFNSFFTRRHIDNTLKNFLRNFVNVLIKALFVLFVLNVVGIETTSLLTVIGAASLAIGLALQGTLTNFAGGVIILLFRPFKVGDRIEAQTKKGVVQEIQIFNTVILTPENKTVLIPNSLLSNGIIEIDRAPESAKGDASQPPP
ncbi:MAG: hypothetical protein C5B52_14515 [Bacteroidetes bacterium]|nr:MAG: hypothetical protein C5B52_14515 [Bacteroidota bacterium]